MTGEPLVTIRDVVKEHQALRPLRIQELTLVPGQVLTLVGLDAPAAEVLVGLLTGALLPDRGEVTLLGRSTADIQDSDAWLRMLDGVGILTDRAVLLEQFSVLQNIAMPFTLDVDPIDAEVRPRAESLARAVGLAAALDVPIAAAGAGTKVRVRMARALALGPAVLLAEHPSATLPRSEVRRFASDLAGVVKSRGVALLSMTADGAFARALGGEIVIHDAATGLLRPRGLFTRLFG